MKPEEGKLLGMFMSDELLTVETIEKEIRAILDGCPNAVRVHEGGGHENLLQSLAVTVSKLQRQVQMLKYPDARLEGSYPVVLYLNTAKDRDDLIEAAREFNPNLKMEKL